MSRKSKKTVEVQFDDNGNPVEASMPEPTMTKEERQELDFQIEVVAMMTSNGGEVYPNPMAWGKECFTTAQIVKNCVRLDVAASSRQISAYLRRTVGAGILSKQSTKLYCYNVQRETEKEDFKALLETLRPGRFPTH